MFTTVGATRWTRSAMLEGGGAAGTGLASGEGETAVGAAAGGGAAGG